MPPAASTHPREPEIKRLAEPAAGQPATHASHQAQASIAAGAEDDLEYGAGTRERANRASALPTPSKEDFKCSLDFTRSSNIQRNSQSAFPLDAIRCKKSSHLDPCGTSSVGCRFQPSWVPHRQFLNSPLPWQQSALCFSGFCFRGKTIVKGLCAYPGRGLPAAQAGTANACLPSSLVAQ